MNSRVMLIDGNSIGFASHQTRPLTYDGQQVQAIYGFIRTLKKLKQKFPAYQPIVLWDGISWRYNIYSDYKGNRKDPKVELMKAEYKKQKPTIQEACQYLNIQQVTVANYEADDLAAIYAVKIAEQGGNVILVSGDKDWLQIVRPKVSWYDPIRDKTCTLLDFESVTGCSSPNQFVDLKCLMGDTSDNIKGVGGLGEVRAHNLLNEYNSVDNFLNMSFNEEELNAMSRYNREFWLHGREKYEFNKKLVKLCNQESRPSPEGSNIIVGRFEADKFENLCYNLGFLSIAKEVETYNLYFGENK